MYSPAGWSPGKDPRRPSGTAGSSNRVHQQIRVPTKLALFVKGFAGTTLGSVGKLNSLNRRPVMKPADHHRQTLLAGKMNFQEQVALDFEKMKFL